MKGSIRLFVCAMMICAATAQDSPRISNAYPPLEDVRRPDLTISDGVSRASAAIAYNPNGRFLAVAGRDNSIRLYDARPSDRLSAELAQTLKGHTSAILAIGFNGTNTLVSVSEDQTAKIWDIVSGKLLHSVELNFGKQLVPAIARGPEPFLAGGTLKQVRLWNYRTGELLKSFEANDSNVAALAFTPDGKLLVIGTTKGVVRVMDVPTWKVTRMIDLDSPVYSLAASMSHVGVGYGDGTVALLDLVGEQNSVPEGKKQTERINALAFNADGNRLASASADGTIKVWETAGLKLFSSLEGSGGEVRSVVFSPNGHQVTAAGVTGAITSWVLR